MEPLLLKAFKGTNERVPVWFMRQAGRYLPEYRAIREKYPLEEMFRTPELASEITCLPISILGVDAAILFADILTLPAQMGFDIVFDNKKGPQIQPFRDLKEVHDYEDLSYVAETVKTVKDRLPADIPLIGFAGAPFTVLTYLIEGGSTVNFSKTFRFIQQQPQVFHQLMERLTANTIRYIDLQKAAGIDVFQLFDSWVGILKASDYARYVLPYVQKIFSEVDLPSIYFARNSHHMLPLMNQTHAEFLSVDQTVVLGHHVTIEHTQKGVQGNLFNGLLYADRDVIKKEVQDVLAGGLRHPRYIFNLSHGVFPDVDVDKLKYIVDLVHGQDIQR